MHASKRLFILCLVIQAHLLPTCMSQGDDRPLILIYSPKVRNYSLELKRLIDEDPRVDADVEVLETPQILRVKMYFPNVKMVIVALATSINEQLGPTLEWFFSQGGGLVGLGFAGMRVATVNASEKVFPIFGSAYITGTYDPGQKKFVISHLKNEADLISEGIGDFAISDHKVILSFNSSSNSYLPRYPEEGEHSVLYKDVKSGAPTIVKYQNVGVSVTFACFGGDDFERGPSYHGHFTGTEEFKKLFTNAVAWVWGTEEKYAKSTEEAARYFEEADEERQSALQEGRDLERQARNRRTSRSIIILTMAFIGVLAVYWLTFARVPKTE